MNLQIRSSTNVYKNVLELIYTQMCPLETNVYTNVIKLGLQFLEIIPQSNVLMSVQLPMICILMWMQDLVFTTVLKADIKMLLQIQAINNV